MFHRLLNVSLLIAAVIGAVLAYRVTMKHQELLAEHQRLEAKVGSLPIEDPTKIHLRALDTHDELHFAWRVYVPAGLGIRWENGGGSGTSWNSSACHFIARVRLRQSEDGCLQVFTKQGGSSSRFQVGSRELADLLREHWSEIQVEQLGTNGTTVVENDEVATLVRLALPDDLKQEAEQKIGQAIMRYFQKGLLEIRFGSDRAFQQAAARGQTADEL